MTDVCNNYGDLQEFLFDKAISVGQPLNGMFELTNRCNLSCQMCYIAEPANDKRSKALELSSREWVELSRQATQAGMLFVCLTGGEPFLREDFFEIYEPLTKMGLNITLFTNATLIRPAIANRLAMAPPSRLEVSLYGATEKVYERVTGVAGSYRRCLKGIDALKETGKIPILIKTTLSHLNKHEFSDMRKLAQDRDLPFHASWLLTKHRNRKSDGAADIRLLAEEIVKIEIDEGVLAGFTAEPEVGSKLKALPCDAGQASFAINAYGEMNACIDLPIPRAKPLQIGFADAWEATRKAVEAIQPSKTCSVCEDEHYCSCCPAYALLESGSLDASIPYLCEVARLRRRALENIRK